MALLKLQQQNVAAAAAYTEYSLTIPPRINELTLMLRATGANIFWYMAASGSGSPGTAANLPAVYNTIPIGNSRTVRGLLGAQTIFFQTDGTAQVLEADYYADT